LSQLLEVCSRCRQKGGLTTTLLILNRQLTGCGGSW